MFHFHKNINLFLFIKNIIFLTMLNYNFIIMLNYNLYQTFLNLLIIFYSNLEYFHILIHYILYYNHNFLLNFII